MSLKLGDKHTVNGKEYAIVYGDSNCTKCEVKQQCYHFSTLTGNDCLLYIQGRWQQIVWIEVKK